MRRKAPNFFFVHSFVRSEFTHTLIYAGTPHTPQTHTAINSSIVWFCCGCVGVRLFSFFFFFFSSSLSIYLLGICEAYCLVQSNEYIHTCYIEYTCPHHNSASSMCSFCFAQFVSRSSLFLSSSSCVCCSFFFLLVCYFFSRVFDSRIVYYFVWMAFVWCISFLMYFACAAAAAAHFHPIITTFCVASALSHLFSWDSFNFSFFFLIFFVGFLHQKQDLWLPLFFTFFHFFHSSIHGLRLCCEWEDDGLWLCLVLDIMIAYFSPSA